MSPFYINKSDVNVLNCNYFVIYIIYMFKSIAEEYRTQVLLSNLGIVNRNGRGRQIRFL